MSDHTKNPVISVRNLGIHFSSEVPTLQAEILWWFHEVKGTLSELVRGRFRLPFRNNQPKRHGKWVFRNFDFEVHKGEVFGIIGANGCGKTTLLKILSSVLFPSEGEAVINGRVASLLAVGTGFNMAYTGRENVFLNGMILGLSKKQIEEQFDQITDFADIGEAIDMPVRTYSSGMRARLAFSVAAQLQSEIVILDEVLSVGDAGFREKSLEVIQQMKHDGRTIILVSHNMGSIERFCDRAMLIKSGKIVLIDEPDVVTSEYLGQFRMAGAATLPLSERQDRFGSGVLRVTEMYFSRNGEVIDVPRNTDDVKLVLEYEIISGEYPKKLEIGVAIRQEDGHKLVRLSTDVTGEEFINPPRRGRLCLLIPRFPLVKGTYSLDYRVVCDGEMADHIVGALKFECEEGDFFGTGLSDFHSPIYLQHEWQIENIETSK